MTDSSITIPDQVTFEQAIALTQTWLHHLDQQQLSEDESEALVTQLVTTENGARGFFVAYLTDERPFADHPPLAVLNGLHNSPKLVADLLVKNLAMSTAMAIAHRRNQQASLAEGSERVRSRAFHLLQLVQLPEVQSLSQELVQSVMAAEGVYTDFLNRWGYDVEQRSAIQETFRLLLQPQEPATEKN